MNSAAIITPPEGYPPLLTDIAEFVAQSLVENGIERERAALIAFGAAEEVRAQYGGQQSYIPVGKDFEMSRKEQEIFAKCNGRNYDQLAREYGMSVVWVRQLEKRGKARERAKRQGRLFE